MVKKSNRKPATNMAGAEWRRRKSKTLRMGSRTTQYNPHMSAHPHSPGFLNADTDAASEHQQITRWRAMSPAEKFRAVTELNAAADTMALAGIRLRHPGASPREQF